MRYDHLREPPRQVISLEGRVKVVRGSAAELLATANDDRLVCLIAKAVGGTYDLDSNRGQVGAWRNSLPELLRLLCDIGLGDVEVLLEYQLPYSPKRADALLCGRHPDSGEPSYVLIELKQWSEARAVGDGLVEAAMVRSVQLHPVAQVRRYRQHLVDFTPWVARQGTPITAIAYLHNARRADIEGLYNYTPEAYVGLYAADQRPELVARLRSLLAADSRAESQQAATDLLSAEWAPARTLLRTAADAFDKRDDFVLLDEQQVAFNLVLGAVSRAAANNGRSPHRKTVIIVRGGPGSGKSALAMSLVTRLARRRMRVVHATGSKAFTETLRTVVARDDPRTTEMFKYFNTVSGRHDELDVLVCDEAHRIRGGHPERRTLPEYERRQINSLIDAAKVPVFLLDEHQVVRPDERGTPGNIRKAAEARGYDVDLVDLEGQFRCGGSQLFDEWVVRLLGLAETAPIGWTELVADTRDEYVVHAARSPQSLEDWLHYRSTTSGGSTRMSAGYCWDWSPPATRDGRRILVPDIDLEGWCRPWNTPQGESVPDVPSTSLWASDERGVGQVGCVYTAQGFEYDWAGVIFGKDLVIRDGVWRPQQPENKDKVLKATSSSFFDRLVRNIYKVLLTRGMQGVCLYSVDAETNEFLRHHAR